MHNLHRKNGFSQQFFFPINPPEIEHGYQQKWQFWSLESGVTFNFQGPFWVGFSGVLSSSSPNSSSWGSRTAGVVEVVSFGWEFHDWCFWCGQWKSPTFSFFKRYVGVLGKLRWVPDSSCISCFCWNIVSVETGSSCKFHLIGEVLATVFVFCQCKHVMLGCKLF